jgi:glycosyltransferase involved in cell wall biosynthesis
MAGGRGLIASDVRPIRVLDLRDTHEIGGPGKTILETYNAIDRDRFSLHLAMFRPPDDRAETPFLKAAREIGMPVHELVGHGPYDVGQVWRLAQLVRDQEFDIVHPHEQSSDAITYAMSWIRRVPIVTTAHGWIGNTPKQRAMVALDKRVMRRFDRVIAVSDRIRRDLIDAGVAEKKIRLLHNAIVIENYRRDAAAGILESFVGKALPRPVIVSIGRLSPEKGHADLIEALRLAAERGRHVSAVLAGDGPSRADLVERIRAADLQSWVHLPGYVKQPARLLQDADLMVLPSHTEGLPNAALEALAMQVPVLATDVGGTPEVVFDGENGMLIPPRSPQRMAEGNIDFLDNPGRWQQWAQRGRHMVEKQFNFTIRTRKLESLYQEMGRTPQ